MLSSFYGSYVVIFNSNRFISSWVGELVDENKFSHRAVEFRSRIINIASEFDDNISSVIDINDLQREPGIYTLNNAHFKTNTIPGKSSPAKPLYLKANYKSRALSEFLSQHSNVISDTVFFITEPHADDIKYSIGSTRKLLAHSTITCQCQKLEDVEASLSLGADYAHSIHESNNYLLLGEVLESHMIKFLKEIINSDEEVINSDEEVNSTPTLFDFEVSLNDTLKVEITKLYDTASHFGIEILSFYHSTQKRHKVMPKSGVLALPRGKSSFICWGYDGKKMIEFRESAKRIFYLHKKT